MDHQHQLLLSLTLHLLLLLEQLQGSDWEASQHLEVILCWATLMELLVLRRHLETLSMNSVGHNLHKVGGELPLPFLRREELKTLTKFDFGNSLTLSHTLKI
jgi:hypothetical protein